MMAALTEQQREAILLLGRAIGWGSDVEPEVLIELTRFGLIEVDGDRHVVLTASGQRTYRQVKPKPR